MFLEDPAVFHEMRERRNLADTVGEQQWTRITDAAKMAWVQLNGKLHRWFHWAEIMDPRVIPEDKTQRLPSLAHALSADPGSIAAEDAAEEVFAQA